MIGIPNPCLPVKSVVKTDPPDPFPADHLTRTTRIVVFLPSTTRAKPPLGRGWISISRPESSMRMGSTPSQTWSLSSLKLLPVAQPVHLALTLGWFFQSDPSSGRPTWASQLLSRSSVLRLLRGLDLHGAQVMAHDGGINHAELVGREAVQAGLGVLLGRHDDLEAREGRLGEGGGGGEEEEDEQGFHGTGKRE